ncbi:Ig-like domain-containing protein [Nocardioides sp. W7]|uniref:Ig-like domain-containing protein n=1 Tax=Nocardioides sp. W7 TaxID=2931390 RepID=UPI001FD02CB7|nr:Ig-like domain-containing protein [Nocardioides sp. W7]
MPPRGASRATHLALATAVVSTGLSVLVGGSSAIAAPAPDPVTFTAGVGAYSGTVPDGSCFVDVRVTGGAGGHNMVGGGVSQPDANGAAARISTRFAVVPGESFGGVVGGGGAQARTAGSNGGGNGGELTGSNQIHPGAGGGGWTSLQLDGVDVVVAGAGGGSGGGHSLNQGGGGDAGLPTTPGVTAGAGGVNGVDEPAVNVVGSGAGGGTAGPGAAGSNSADGTRSGTPGVGRTGGDAGSDDTPDTGGGGGGGWFGGGGAASTVGNGNGGLSNGGVTGAGGGGGASFVAADSPGLPGFAVSGLSSVAVGERATAGSGQDGDVVLDFVPCDYDLAVTKTVDDTTPAPGDTVTWTVTVTNNGPEPMTRGDLLTIDDTLPGPGAKTVTSVDVTGGTNARDLARGAVSCGVSDGDAMPATVTCLRPYADGVASSPDSGERGLDSGETVTIVYTQEIPTGTPGGTIIDNVVTVTDRGPGANNTDNDTVTVTAGPPVATDDARNTPFDTPVDLPATGNDDPSDPGTPLVPASTVFTSPAATGSGKSLVTTEGTWQVNPDGTVTFSPAPGYTGTTAPVEYRITDAAGGTDTADLVVTVRPGPTATPDTDSTPQDVEVTVDPLPNDTPGLLADGSAGSWDETSVVFPAGPNPGTVTDGGKTLTVPGEGVYTIDPATGEITFDPEPQFTGVATAVTYQVTDSHGHDATSTVTITVTPIVPVANDDTASTAYNTPVTLPAVTDDDAGAASAPLVPGATVFTSPDATNGGKTLVTPEGTWQVEGDGSVTFTPASGYTGTTPAVEYEITDENGTTDTAVLTVTVRSGPTAEPDTGSTPHDTTITVPLLPNDTPGPLADGTPGAWDPSTVVFTSPQATDGGRTLLVPGEGRYTIDPATGAVTFDPEPGFSGQATPVGYQVTDSNGNSVQSTVTITVAPAPPVAAPQDDYDLVLAKRAVGGTLVKVGDSVRYELTVRNKGKDAARGPIRLTDPLPRGLELVSAKGKGWTCKTRKASDTVTCVLKKGLAGRKKAAPVFVVAKATRAAVGRSVNVAKVSVAGESVRSNNKGRATITVVPPRLPSTGFRPTPRGM